MSKPDNMRSARVVRLIEVERRTVRHASEFGGEKS